MNFGYFLKERQRIEEYLKGYLTLSFGRVGQDWV